MRLCLHHLFERWVDVSPDALAIASEDVNLTYAQVEYWANHLAHLVRERGALFQEKQDVKRDDLIVGIYLHRSAEAIVAILAVLKAGAAYVPMDPSTTPIDRATHIAESASICMLITTPDLEEAACRFYSGPVLHQSRLSDQSSVIPSLSHRLNEEETSLTPKRLCYVLYTSGSTGRPKGIMAEHRNVVSFVKAFNKVVKMKRTDRIFQGFALGFDGSVEEMWMAFSNGAVLVVERQGEKRVGDELASWLNKMNVTVHSTVPTALSMIGNIDLIHVRLLILSGEPCTTMTVQKWATRGRRLLNVYGPTEATVNTTWFECRQNEKVTIGIPLDNYKVLVLDKDLHDVDVGQVGELYIGGPTVSRGYLNAPGLTAKSFVDLTPVRSQDDIKFRMKQVDSTVTVAQDERFFRTGDLVRRLDASGQLDFLGRIDNQVKIRGYRVELSEIEEVAAEDPNVCRAVAVLVQRGESSSSIALYVTYRGMIDRANTAKMLEKKLPHYMIPTFLEEVSHFPTLPSGKVDRSQLPTPSQLLVPFPSVSSPSYVGHHTVMERQVAQAFQHVLGISKLPSVEDCFFTTLGGDSLTAAHLVQHLREKFSFEVAIREIYGAPKVRELAAVIENKSRRDLQFIASPPAQSNVLHEPKPVSGFSRFICHLFGGLVLSLLYRIGNFYLFSALTLLLIAWEIRYHRLLQFVASPLERSKVLLEPTPVSRSTRFACHFFQGLVLVLLYGFYGIPYLVSTLALFLLAWEIRNHQPISLRTVILLVVSFFIIAPLMLVVSLLVKWIVIGRYREGHYPLYGAYYFRWWIVDKFQTAAVSSFAGTPWLSLYYWLMGAKVGKRCYLGTANCSCFDVVSIGDDTSIGFDTQLLGYRIEDGLLKIGRVDIGSRVFVGIHSCLGLDVQIGDDAKIDNLTAIHDGMRVGSGMGLRGSPASPANVVVPSPSKTEATRTKVFRYYLAHWLVWQCVALTTLLTWVPSLLLAFWTIFPLTVTFRVLVLPFLPVFSVVWACLLYSALCRLFAQRDANASFSIYSCRYLKRWYIDAIMATTLSSLHVLYTTIYCPAWLRLMGIKVGEWAEISTISWFAPDLTVLGPQSFFADGSIIGGHRIYCGRIQTMRVTIGRRSFVGNSAIVPTGSGVGDECLLGVLSLPPEPPCTIQDGSEWIGNPAFRILHRNKVDGYGEHETHKPTTKLVCQRLLVDFFRIWIPGMIQSSGFLIQLVVFLVMYDKYGLAVALSLYPFLNMGLNWMGVLLVIALKRALVPRFQPIIRPLWSMFVWINELINGAYETIMAPSIAPLLGTPFCIPPLRWIGCKIGRRCWIGTTLFSEFDLVNIGSDTVLNYGVIIQNHLFEDRIMKASTLFIGDHCNIGNMSVILYDSKIGNKANIAALSLVMKGETIPAGGTYAGIPTQLAVNVRAVIQEGDPDMVQ